MTLIVRMCERKTTHQQRCPNSKILEGVLVMRAIRLYIAWHAMLLAHVFPLQNVQKLMLLVFNLRGHRNVLVQQCWFSFFTVPLTL